VVGEGDIADICKLTCLEQGVSVVDLPEVPVLEVHGVKVVLHLQEIPLQIDSSDGRQAAV
jgi:hypothetical protein